MLENHGKSFIDDLLNNFSEGVDMSMMFGKAWGGYCLGFTEGHIRFVFNDSLLLLFFMLWVLIITLLTKFLYAPQQPFFIKKYAKNSLIAFIVGHSYWVIVLQKIHRTPQERKNTIDHNFL